VINRIGWLLDDHDGPSPIVYNTVTRVFALISCFAVVDSDILISTDNWLPYCAMAVSTVSCLIAESHETIIILNIAQFFLDCYTTTAPVGSLWLESKRVWHFNVFFISTTVFLNHLAEESQIQTNDFASESNKKILTQVIWHVSLLN